MSVVLDINTPEGLDNAIELIGQCDVLLENFRPGMMEKFGLDYATLSAKYPHLIYVSHKGFLPGPYENRLALDEVVQMMGGLSYMTGPVGRPLRAGSSVNDIMGGMFGAIGVLSAILERQRTGRGQEIQSALFENCAFLCSQHMQQFSMTGEPPPPMPSRVSAWSVYDVFTLAHGERRQAHPRSSCRSVQVARTTGHDGKAEQRHSPQFVGRRQEVLQVGTGSLRRARRAGWHQSGLTLRH